MRLWSRFILRLLTVGLAAGTAFGQVIVTLGTTTGCGSLQGGQTCTLTARVTGTSNAAVTWSFSPTVPGATVGTGTAPDATGLSTNTYKAPNLVTTKQIVTATATSVADTTQAASALITLTPVPTAVVVAPATVTLGPGQNQVFTATVTGTSQNGVTWSISPLVGSISANGAYTAPASITTSQKITVTATSTFDSTAFGTATVTLQPANTLTVTVSPATVTMTNNQIQLFTATVQNGPAGVTWSISPQTGTIDSFGGFYTAPILINSSSKVTVTATSTADPTKSGSATVTLNPLVDVGIGSPNGAVQQQFVQAFYRNGFNLQVTLPPVANVKRLGSTGYVQEFNDANTSGAKAALVTISPTATGEALAQGVIQLWSSLYAYFNTVGVATAGYPLMDTQACPSFDVSNSCTWDLFDKGYALFTYDNAIATGQNFTIRQGFYTEWTTLGGITGPGRPVDVETAITASTTTTATVQAYAFGAVYSVTSGIYKGKVFGVKEPIYDLYVSQGGPTGMLGLPTSELFQAAVGVYRQTFEGGALQYTGDGGPTVQLPVKTVTLTGATTGNVTTLALGQSVTVSAVPYASTGQALTDRPVSWSSTNSKVIAIQASGQTAVLTAVGGGSASVTAASGGVSSVRLNFVVTSPCCQVGDGATATVRQAFVDALGRNKVALQLPVQGAAARVGNGYVQMAQAADGGTVMLAKADAAGTAYVVSGAVLARYLELGGPAGALGYPVSDQSTGGTQIFANAAALGGAPVRVVSDAVLAKWAAMQYETGGAGPPVEDAAEFSTFGANSGRSQAFRNGTIYGASAGPRAGQGYFVSGLILAGYAAAGGPDGDYGMPVSDELVSGGAHQQNFEGGNFTYAAGDTAAAAHPAAKVPGVVVAPSSIAAGGRARLAIMGFPNNSTVRVSITGQPDFVVTTANGAYSWDMAIALSARSGSMTIRAVDTGGAASASGTLTVRGFVDNRLAIAKPQGDDQTGMPGAVLPVSLRIALRDASGAPVVGAAVSFQASPGAVLLATDAVTDGNGEAGTFLRLPASEGVTAVAADAPSIAKTPVTFYARSAASGLVNFPKLVQAGAAYLGSGSATIAQKGALLTAVAAILRYHQNRGELAAPNGPVDAAALNLYLQSYCAGKLCDGFLSNPDSGEQVVNLWRAGEFTGGVDVRVMTPSTAAIADLVAQGSPALVSLALSRNGSVAGGHFVAAMGVAADGSILVQDPNPLFARTSLNDYLNGFSAAGALWKAELRGVVQFARRPPSSTRFLAAALSQPADLMNGLALDVASAAGSCGLPLELLDAVDSSGNGTPLVSRIVACDGLDPVYQLAVGATRPYRASVTDLAPGGGQQDLSGNSPATYGLSRPKLALVVEPVSASFTVEGVVNAATLTPGIAPNGLMAIFGTGLAGAGTATTVEIDGVAAQVLSATAFRVNAVVPAETEPGQHMLRVRSAFGTAEQTVEIAAVAPAVFGVFNQDFTLNGATNPLARGQAFIVYATGLGAVRQQGNSPVTTETVSFLLNGQELPASFAGLDATYAGVYQVNLPVPASTPPGLSLTLALKIAGQVSGTVQVAVQ